MQEFNSNTPIYLQIIRSIEQLIVSEKWPAGSRVSSVRELALKFGVNPNTVQRALSQLESSGLLYTERTAGRFVTDDTELISQIRERLAESIISKAFEELKSLGYSLDKIKDLIQNQY